MIKSLLRDDVLLALGGVEIDGQLDSLGLVHSERQVGLLLEVAQTEALQVLFGKGLGVEDAGRRGLAAAVHADSLGRSRHVTTGRNRFVSDAMKNKVRRSSNVLG